VSAWTIILGTAFIVAFSGCKKKAPAPVKAEPRVGVYLEVQVFRMPRLLAVASVLNQPKNTNYAVVLKRVQDLVAEKKAELVGNPSIITLSGNRAVVESVLEHKYPTEFSAPERPPNTGSTNPEEPKANVATGVPREIFATPTAFEKRDVGVTLEIEPGFDPKFNIITFQTAVAFITLQESSRFVADGGEIVEQPNFYAKKISTNGSVRNGGVAFLGTIEPYRPKDQGEDLTEVAFLRASTR